jgi:hypothetical protein
MAAVPPLWLTVDPDSALAAAMAVGITVVGGLAFGWRRL